VTNFGIERLRIERLDPAYDSIISLDLAENGWIRECEVAWATRAHIDVARSRQITVRSNDIHHAHNYGNGGYGYGIAVSRTNDSLFEDNLIYTTRHSLVVSLGSNGNVFAYNYSRDHQVSEPDLADVVSHGHYAHTNLFEGNVVDSIRVGDWWGPTPDTTLYRNRLLYYIAVQDHSHSVNVLGNTLFDDGGINVDESVQGAFLAHNLIGGQLPGNDVSNHLPASLWRTQAPPYWGDRPWPCTGADVDMGTSFCRIPAQDRDRGW
jgi:Right handed beta helix region